MNRRSFLMSVFAAPFLSKVKPVKPAPLVVDQLFDVGMEWTSNGLAFHKDAFTMCSLPLPIPSVEQMRIQWAENVVKNWDVVFGDRYLKYLEARPHRSEDAAALRKAVRLRTAVLAPPRYDWTDEERAIRVS